MLFSSDTQFLSIILDSSLRFSESKAIKKLSKSLKMVRSRHNEPYNFYENCTFLFKKCFSVQQLGPN